MERTIDRTSYRRSARSGTSFKTTDKEVKTNKSSIRFKLANLVLNETIAVLILVIGVLTLQYFDVIDISKWIKENMSNGHSITELYSIVKNKFFKNGFNFNEILDNTEYNSGESNIELIPSGESIISGDNFMSGEITSAVEGINQMSDDAKQLKKDFDFKIPVNGVITSHFGSRISDNPIVSSYHTGLDIAANSGTEICASHDGKVIMAKEYSSYGNCVMIENGNLITVYAHCLSINVDEGQTVKNGDIIAKVGMTGNATGPHLHFEIRFEGRFVDPELIINL